jgi:hypothetical protein
MEYAFSWLQGKCCLLNNDCSNDEGDFRFQKRLAVPITVQEEEVIMLDYSLYHRDINS